MDKINLAGFKKVDQDMGGTFILARFWNPETGETKSECVRDYDYADCSRDNDDLYYMEIDQDARVKWLHSRGVILEGDTVEIFKGRKFPKGTIKKVRKIYPFKDKYKRWIADYAYFEDGTKCNVANCRLIS